MDHVALSFLKTVVEMDICAPPNHTLCVWLDSHVVWQRQKGEEHFVFVCRGGKFKFVSALSD